MNGPQKFNIHKAYSDQDRLPSAHTWSRPSRLVHASAAPPVAASALLLAQRARLRCSAERLAYPPTHGWRAASTSLICPSTTRTSGCGRSCCVRSPKAPRASGSDRVAKPTQARPYHAMPCQAVVWHTRATDLSGLAHATAVRRGGPLLALSPWTKEEEGQQWLHCRALRDSVEPAAARSTTGTARLVRSGCHETYRMGLPAALRDPQAAP